MTGLLLDTHALLSWWAGENLSPQTRETISDPDVAVFASAASAWEIDTKVRLGRLTDHGDMVSRFDELTWAAGIRHLPINHRHVLRAGSYRHNHPDPFDRMLAAQAELESLTLVTGDKAFEDFPVQTLW